MTEPAIWDILQSMSTTTIKVDTETRDQLRSLMGSGTYDELLRKLIRRERQRRMAAELATWEPTIDEETIMRAGAADMARLSDAPR